jgi:hypothetical protein
VDASENFAPQSVKPSGVTSAGAAPPGTNPPGPRLPGTKTRFVSVLLAILAVVSTVCAVLALVAASIRISNIADPAWRRIAISAELVGGVLWLLGIVYVATHLAVIIFANPAPPGSPIIDPQNADTSRR